MVKTHSIGKIAFINMNAPPVNALGQELRSTLLTALNQYYADDSIAIVVIGSDLPLFCGGADIEEFKTGQLWDAPDLHALIDAIDNAPKLVVAAINGYVLGN